MSIRLNHGLNGRMHFFLQLRSIRSKCGFYEQHENPRYWAIDGRQFQFKEKGAPASAPLVNISRGCDLKGWRIRTVNIGCTDRPFYLLVVQRQAEDFDDPYSEQLGAYDPLRNKYGERLMALNVDRFRFWITEGAEPTKTVRRLLGLAGVLPIHPKSYLAAWRRRTLGS
ncbi:hypothetical protein ACOME3_001366 [Neoechinorhynchus agilis]